MPRPFARPHLSRPRSRSLLRSAPRDARTDAPRDRLLELVEDVGREVRRDVRGGARRDASPDRAASAMAAKRARKVAALRACGRRCVYCATELGLETATLDHVVPRAQGGPDAPGNLVAACAACNRMKADLHPVEFFLRHPWAGENFVRYARTVHRALKRGARRAVSLAHAA